MNTDRLDVIIRGGRVVDGTGTEPFAADVGTSGGLIARVGDLKDETAPRIIQAQGLYVVPGFVDMHTHSERGLHIPELAASVHNLKQGVTTVVGGADGYGSWPLHETIQSHVELLTRQGIGTNAVLMVGAGQVRRLVMGTQPRDPTPAELARMRQLVRNAMDGGAHGLSSGLAYPPGRHAKTEELIDLAGEVVPYGGIYHSHIRDEADGLVGAVEEAIRVAEESGATGVITHFKAVYRRNWGKIREATQLIEAARQRGVRVYADQFPFKGGEVKLIPEATWHGSTDHHERKAARLMKTLGTLSDDDLVALYEEMAGPAPLSPQRREFLLSRPGLAREMVSGALSHMAPAEGRALMELESWYGVNRGPGSPAERARFLLRLADPEEGAEIRRQVEENVTAHGGAGSILIVTSARPDLVGKTVMEASRVLRKPVADTAIQLALERARTITSLLSDDDIEHLMRKDYVATGSDGDYPYFGADIDPMGIAQHISSYGTFTTKIRRYALDRQTISLPHAIRSCTGLPAEILGWRDRGLIKEGYMADIAVFDPSTIRPMATATDVHRYSEGVEYVLVNGRLALDGGEPTGTLAGRVLAPAKPWPSGQEPRGNTQAQALAPPAGRS